MAVGRVKGIGEINADAKTKTLCVDYDPSEVTVEGVQQALAGIGHESTVLT